MGHRRRKLLFLLLLAALLGVWLIFQPGCPIRNLTGMPCPGCGMSRAWRAALGLDLRAAFRFHPMFWTLPVILWLGWKEFRPFRRMWINWVLAGGIAGALMVCYAFRLYFQLIV